MQYLIKGFPNISEVFVDPINIAELLAMPMFCDADIDLAWRYGTDFQRKLISKTPLHGNRKHVIVHSHIQYLYPEVRGSVQKLGGFDSEWHVDSSDSPLLDEDIMHIYNTECTALTEFNEKPIEIDVDKDISSREFRLFLNANKDMLGLKGRKIKPNTITTFTNHIHRASVPLKNEIRYVFRVLETNTSKPSDKFIISHSTVYSAESGVAMKSIEYINDTVNIYTGGV